MLGFYDNKSGQILIDVFIDREDKTNKNYSVFFFMLGFYDHKSGKKNRSTL